MKIHTITFILLVVGGLNWGLEALGFGVGSYLPSQLAMIIYVLIALSAIYEVFTHKSLCRNCNPQGAM